MSYKEQEDPGAVHTLCEAPLYTFQHPHLIATKYKSNPPKNFALGTNWVFNQFCGVHGGAYTEWTELTEYHLDP